MVSLYIVLYDFDIIDYSMRVPYNPGTLSVGRRLWSK